MNLKKRFERFFSLKNGGNGGFTLVELIVVIAILAILAGIGVPAYSGYVKKANMQADMTLVADVEYAVSLYNYSTDFAAKVNTGSGSTVGYVILTETTSDAKTTLSGDDTNHINNAMVAAFGDNWKNTATLSYDGWTDTATMLKLAQNQYAGSVNSSSYIQNVGTDKLLSDVQGCAGSLAEFLVGLGWSGEDSAKALNGILGGDSSELPEILKNYEGEITSEVLANATVFGVANTMQDQAASAEIIGNFTNGYYIMRNWNHTGNPYGYSPITDNFSGNILTYVAHTYAALEAYVGYLNNPNTTAIFNSIDMSGNKGQIIASVAGACSAVMDYVDNVENGLGEKSNNYFYGGQGKTDGEAYVAVMQSVNELQDDYVSDLNNTGLFSGEGMADRVNCYVSAASLADLIEDDTLLSAIANGQYGSAIILVFNTKDGVLICNPCYGQ